MDYAYDKNEQFDKQGTYSEKCTSCGRTIFVLTQAQEHNPEYYTHVFVICPICDEELEFVLPVN